MSGAQGAQPKGAFTATTYHTHTSTPTTTPASAPRPMTYTLLSHKDEPGVPVDKLEDKVAHAAGHGGPVFGAGSDDAKPDLGVSATG